MTQIRLYRVRWFFEHLEFNLTVSLLWSTLARNLTVPSLPVLVMHPAAPAHAPQHVPASSPVAAPVALHASTLVVCIPMKLAPLQVRPRIVHSQVMRQQLWRAALCPPAA